MPNLVCPQCEIEYRPLVSGVAAESMMVEGAYQLWSADVWECPGCHAHVVCRFGASPVAEHFQPDYSAALGFFQGKPLIRFWANQQEKLAAGPLPIPAEQPVCGCRFYGMSGQGGFDNLYPTGGNQCARVLASHTPCAMEISGRAAIWELLPAESRQQCPGDTAALRVIPYNVRVGDEEYAAWIAKLAEASGEGLPDSFCQSDSFRHEENPGLTGFVGNYTWDQAEREHATILAEVRRAVNG